MTDQELVTTVAITLATKTAEGLAAGGRAAFEALARLVRHRFKGRASVEAALDENGSEPADTRRAETLREALAQAVADDPAFETELRNGWRALSPHLIAGGDGVVNSVSGTVQGHVVQARDVHGGISFGSPGRDAGA
ncbi:hypothetical protein Asp14428_57130 [Actinoplanes sp. NBRC 14428]|uniref:RIP homotypic interaction motif (RHIM)-containing protein n=1 Tax=Pseudosporangium ferrugineum TaxID=439699 RepID=A0A2T0RDQ7_9ACTN|nr:hypothetical protein [Pseudosporangium ferrugineum]PRY19314.1 hypothetical protein CLV70_13518 [Pseudosporangium ferrugineum]BCJ54238.1 hypothetical protein Asp14428_57130 [Actinoplanes sp. NBRC 14428]